jgi:hypothetical protein
VFNHTKTKTGLVVMSYFTRYLKFIRERNPIALNKRNENIARVNVNFKNNNDATAISEFLQGFPFDVKDFPPFDPDLISLLTNQLHHFVCKERQLGDYHTVIGDGGEEAYQNHFANSSINNLIDEIVHIACVELINEDGNLHQSIDQLFFMELQIIPEEERVKFFINSYINHLILPTIISAWMTNAAFNQEMLEKIGSKIMSQIIFESIKNNILKNPNKSPGDIKLLQTINRLTEYDWKCIHAGNVNTLEEAILKKLLQIRQPEEKASFYDIFKPTPVSLEATAKHMLAMVNKAEFMSILNTASRFMSKTLNVLLPSNIDRQCSDVSEYGMPMAINFNNNDYLEYLKGKHLVESNDHPVDIHQNSPLPFSREMITSLTAYFHQAIMIKIVNEDAIKEHKYFKFFIVKIILFAYSQILNKNGSIKSSILNELVEEDLSGVELQAFQAKLLYNYLRKILITVAVLWLGEAEFQKDYSYHHPAANDDLLPNVMGIIENKIKKGLSRRRLKKISGFPIYGDKDLSEIFALPMAPATDEESMRDLIITIQIKFSMVRRFRRSFERFSERNANTISKILEFQRQIDVQRQQYKLVMDSPSQFFGNAVTSPNKFDVASADFKIRLPSLEGQVAKLERILLEIESTFQVESIAQIEERGKSFVKAKKDFDNELKEVEQVGINLLADILFAYSEGKEIEELERLYNEMKGYFKNIYSPTLDTANLAKETRDTYLKRDKLFPRGLNNNIGWEYSLESEAATVVTTKDRIMAELAKIQGICANIKASEFKELAISESSIQWRKELKSCVRAITRQKSKLLVASTTINEACKPMGVFIDGAKAQHKEIYKMMDFILDQSEFWKRRVSPFWGGDNYNIGNITYKFPKRAVAMMKARVGADGLDPDLKLGKLLSAFNETMPGYCWRSNKTTEFYDIVLYMDQTAKHNFYDNSQLNIIKEKLVDFMKNACEPNYQMYAKYQELDIPGRPPAPGIVEQASELITEVINSARRLIP